MKWTLTIFLLSTLFQGVLNASPVSSDVETPKNEIRVFGVSEIDENKPSFESRFIPYESDPEGYGLQGIGFSSADELKKGISYTRWIRPNWGVELTCQFGAVRYSSDSTTAIHFQWEQWSPSPPFPIRTKDETIEVDRHPELFLDTSSYALSARYRWQKHRFSAGIQMGVSYELCSNVRMEYVYFKTSVQVSRGSLISSERYLVLEGSDTRQFGARLGLDLSYQLTRFLSAFADVHYHYAPGKTSQLQLVDFESIQDFWVADELEEIDPLYQSRELNLNSRGLYVSMGLGFRF